MSSPTPIWGRYTDLRPKQLAAIRSQIPVVYLPWGALDWHGPHLPLGTDGFVAEAVAEQVVQITGGVLMPTTWWPGAALPRSNTLSVRKHIVHGLWSDLLIRLSEEGWRIVVIVNGHYDQDHEMVLIETAEEAIQEYGLLVLALPPLALIDNSLLDHAALWESSMLLSLYPQLVDLYALGNGELSEEQSAIQGRDPRGAASASLGDTVIRLAVDRVARAVNELIRSGNPAPLYALYEQRREIYNRARHGNPPIRK
jgi:creatinine amidohydrolase